MKRIAWLDSCRMPSTIHKTADEGKTTVCGHPCGQNHEQGHWQITSDVPRKRHGRSNYCTVCFADGGKTLPWLEK